MAILALFLLVGALILALTLGQVPRARQVIFGPERIYGAQPWENIIAFLGACLIVSVFLTASLALVGSGSPFPAEDGGSAMGHMMATTFLFMVFIVAFAALPAILGTRLLSAHGLAGLRNAVGFSAVAGALVVGFVGGGSSFSVEPFVIGGGLGAVGGIAYWGIRRTLIRIRTKAN